MLAPQSDAEVRPVVEALQRLDPLLDIQWQPKAILVRRGSYSVHGTRVDPEYDGRWEVIRWDTSVSLHKERTWTRITLVTQLDLTGKYPQMVCDGPYMPIGPWLVSFMQLWDAAQSAFAHQMDVVWREHEAVDAITNDRAAHQEALEKVYRDHAGLYWMGGARGKASPALVASLWPQQ